MRIILSCIFLILSISAFAQDCKPGKGDAVVSQVQGVYVFIDVQPKRDHKFLGQVKHGSSFSKEMFGDVSPERKIQKLVEKAKKEYPDTEGIIIHFSGEYKDRADCIKFEG